ncbi:MAG: formylglycine-generating enzyme family protein [Roseimicrobium sp.]
MQRPEDFIPLQLPPGRRFGHRRATHVHGMLRLGLMALALGLCSSAFCQTPANAPNIAMRARKEFTNSLGMKMVELPGSPVIISIWETRVSDWDAYLKQKAITWTHKPAFPQTSQEPVVNVTLSEAEEFCAWLTQVERSSGVITSAQTYRLPNKAEWDTATGITADGNQSNALFPWGDEWPPMRQSGNYCTRHIAGGRDDGFEFTAPVGQFSPSRSGCYDLGGNVWEWTSDSQQGAPATAALRGGSWMYWRRECLASEYIYPAPGATRSPGIGFRCVLEDAAEVARAAQDRQNSAAKLMEKPSVDQKEIDEAKRKMVEKPVVDQKEIDEMKRKLQERKLPAAQRESSDSPAQGAPAPK